MYFENDNTVGGRQVPSATNGYFNNVVRGQESK
jgi:hypothetical protein